MNLAPRTLRWRLQLWHGILLAAVLLAFGITAVHVERAERLRQLDSDLQLRLSALVNGLRASPSRSGPPAREQPPRPNLAFTPDVQALFGDDTGFYYVIWMRGRAPLTTSRNAPSQLPRPDAGDPVSRTREGRYRETFLFAAPADCVLVGRSITHGEDSLAHHVGLLVAAGGLLLAIGLAGGAWLVRRALNPLEIISTTAERIASGDLSQRVPAMETDRELERLIAVLNATFARLETAFAEQSRFTADAAHELRTPVTALLLETQASLARERSVAELRESLQSCERTGQRVRRLIEQMLELARIESGSHTQPERRCDFAQIAAETILHLTPLAQVRGIVIDHDLDPAPLQGDPDRLAQVVTNLLGNAIQYSPDGSHVKVSTRKSAGSVTLCVSDAGQGIAAEDLPHVFERFFRSDKARTTSKGNAGLGLSIVKAIVTAHGGTIEVSSEIGRGASFSVVIPTHE